MKITSYGAAREVTGTKHLLDINGFRVLLDCGLFQGVRADSDRKNRNMGFDPAQLNAVVLSHAHIDHSGLLPVLCKRGFRGTIYTTAATRDLCAIMLVDSAHIQKRDAEWLTKKQMAFVPPLYEEEDVQEVMRRFVCVSYDMRVPLGPDIFITFRDAGHVLGSAMVDLEYVEAGKPRRFLFTGDMGRKSTPILNDPWTPTPVNVAMMESTYGNRDHGPMASLDEKLASVINETHARGGKVVIPSFALERAQEVIFALKRLESSGAIPALPVYVDSPMTVNITEVFRLHTECFDPEFAALMRGAGEPFDLKRIRYIRNLEESMALNHLTESAIIISASGMCEYGRIVHHLRNTVEDPKNSIVIVGFQAQNTLGRRLVEKQREVRILGVKRELRARVRTLDEFSAHAGRSELLDYGARLAASAEKLILVHGEDEALNALKSGLEERGVRNVSIQEPGVPVEV